MVEILYTNSFARTLKKIKDATLKDKVKKQIVKIVAAPTIGKPMMYVRKGTRELYVKPYRIAYLFKDDKLVFLCIYHKNNQ